MTKERACANTLVHAHAKLERIHQLSIAGQAALSTNLKSEHLNAAASELFNVIADLSAEAADYVEGNVCG